LAFSFFIIGLSSTVLNYAGILPDYPIFTNGGYLGSAIEMLLLSLGLADIINSLFEEKTKAEAKLFDLNKTLEEKVKQRTLDLQDALNDISDLLNNMRQSVFTVNKHKKIMKPVSGFSQFIFNEDITGKDIFETVFNSIEKDSELYAKLNFSFGLMFGQDDLQWLMFKDLFPPTLTYAPKNEKYKEKILKFNYNPLFDKEGLLQKMMFVVEDITDILTLEKEMEKQKEEELQNLEILQELASNKKQDLAEYFKDATINEHNILVTSKLFRSKFEKGEKDVDLSSLFRTLHTLKGNSRIYGLSKISQKIHELENPIADIINSDKNDDIIFKINKMNKLIQGTYDLQGITNRYLKSAKEVFAIDFGENLKFKENFHELIKTFEKKLRQLKQASMTLLRPPFEDDDFISLKMAKNQSFFPDFLKSFKEITHSLKGLSRAMDENELSKMIHSLEGSLFSLEKSFLQSNPIDNELESNFFNSFNAIKEKGRKIYIHSPQFEFSSLKIEEVSNLFFKIFQFTEKVISNNQTNKDDLKRIIYQIITFSKDHNFDFINSIGQLIEISLKKRTDRDYVLFYLIKMWHFLSITTTLNSNELKQKRRDQILLVIEHYKENEETSFQFSSNSILERLLDLTSKSYPENGPFYFFEILEKLLEKNGSTEIPFIFMRKENLHETINSLFYKLKGHFKPFDPDPSDDKLSLSFMNSFFILVHPAFPCSYQVSLDLLKILKNYSGADFENEFYERPNIVEVLEENLLHCQKELAGLFQKPTGDLLIILDKNFEKLKEVPVKYSFSKFKKVVIDISKTLGKKVRFHLSGDQASMSNEKLNIIQEALIHLIRNSLDHGVEKPNIRTRYGKNEIGQIGLTIEKRDHETKLILTDDGAGINLEKVTEKALSEGIINLKELEIMSDKDKIDLIFTPNLSTKEKISEISGRGVGMDVVKKNIEKIGGEIKIETVLGESTRFEITIPH
jgi:chemotaxis protein histidine kinase CheA